MTNGSRPDIFATRFSTDDLSGRDGRAYWRDECARSIMKTDMEPLGDEPFRCSANLQLLPGLGMASIATTSNRATRSREMVKDGNDDLIFSFTLEGAAAISARDEEATVNAGSGILIPSSDPSLSLILRTSSFLSLAIPIAAIAPMIGDLDAALMSVVSESSTALRLLTGYLKNVSEDAISATPNLRHVVTTHVYELVALAFGATRDTAEAANKGGVRTARLHAIKAHVLQNLDQQKLTTANVGLRHGVTSRYVNMLFDEEGTSFEEFVLLQRLNKARRLLTDPRFIKRTISSIAYEAGFSDLSYFNRTFRKRFEMTPSDVRAQMRREL